MDNDLEFTNYSLNTLLRRYNLPTDRLVNINEYGNNAGEQSAAGSAWWISRLERYDAVGLRGHWLNGCSLHDFFAQMIFKVAKTNDCGATDYAPNSQYQVYKYYHMSMTGPRVSTTGSGDKKFDVYATVEEDRIRILAGTRVATGTWNIRVQGFKALGMPLSGSVQIRSLLFEGPNWRTRLDRPRDAGIQPHVYNDDQLIIPVSQTDRTTAQAFEISRI
jgi:hypothetical protein